jgi:hypothetical protein
MYWTVFLLMSLIGFLINEKAFAFHLVMLIRDISLLMFIVQSFTSNGRSILATLVLAFIILYIYTIIAFNNSDIRG